MRKSESIDVEQIAPSVVSDVVRANVSFDLTVPELDALIDLCGDNGHFRLGIRLAERRQRLQSNVNRTKKEQEALAVLA